MFFDKEASSSKGLVNSDGYLLRQQTFVNIARTTVNSQHTGQTRRSLKPGSHIVVIIGNHKQVQANSERNLSQLLQLFRSLYA